MKSRREDEQARTRAEMLSRHLFDTAVDLSYSYQRPR